MNISSQDCKFAKLEAIAKYTRRIVHDLNNYATIYLNVCELLKDDIEGNADALAKLKMLDDTSARMMAFIAELATFRLDNQMPVIAINISDAIAEASEGLVGVSFVRPVDEMLAFIDHKKCVQILRSVINNAQEACGDNIDIKISAKLEDNFVVISIQDNGRGIDSSDLNHVMEPYFSKKEHQKTAGLSLTRAYYLIKGVGGNIDIESVVGRGTLLSISIPGEKSLGKAKPEILIVDDQEALRFLAVEILNMGGYKVLQAANGVEALEVVKKEGKNLTLLITDIVMPGMGGQELAAKLHEKFSAMKVLYMSGYTSDGLFDGSEAENLAFVNKPFSKNILLEAVGKILA